MVIPKKKNPPKPQTAKEQIAAADAKVHVRKNSNKIKIVLEGTINKVKRAKGHKCGAHGKFSCTGCGSEIEKGKGVYDLIVKYDGGNTAKIVFCSKECRKGYIEANGISN